MGDILCDVRSVAARGGASSKSRIPGSRMSGADIRNKKMAEVCLAANGAMKNSQSRNYEGGMDGRIEERKPNTGEGSAEVWGRQEGGHGRRAMQLLGAPVLVLSFLSCPLFFVGWYIFAVPRIEICSSS